VGDSKADGTAHFRKELGVVILVAVAGVVDVVVVGTEIVIAAKVLCDFSFVSSDSSSAAVYFGMKQRPEIGYLVSSALVDFPSSEAVLSFVF
jgi:hypothetical protein